MRRPPQRVDHPEDPERKLGIRAWGIVLGVWMAFFAFLAIVVAPVLFSQCGAGQ